MEIDLKKLDEISKMEDIIEEQLKSNNFENYESICTNYESKVIFVLTIVSILYKEINTIEYMIEHQKNKKIKGYLTYTKNNIEDIIVDLKDCVELKDFIDATKIINDEETEIKMYLKKYYYRKNRNYISASMPIESITNQEKIKDLLKINPFMINQCIAHKPLTEAEKIIYDIIEYYEYNKRNFEIFEAVKDLLILNYNEENLEQTILFIIGNVYQEIEEHPTDENMNMLKAMMENPNIQAENIIGYFIENDTFSNMILKRFIEYNKNIKEGRLQELETKESYQYVKKHKK